MSIGKHSTSNQSQQASGPIMPLEEKEEPFSTDANKGGASSVQTFDSLLSPEDPMSNTLTVELPFDLDPEEARLLLSIKLFEEGKVSLGYAAEMAGYTKRTFIELLGKRGIPVINYPPEDLEREVDLLKALDRERRGGSDIQPEA